MNDLADRNDPKKRGYYFDVADDLSKLPCQWLHRGCFADVPCNAVYKAHSQGTWVWVNADGMEGLSRFTLIIQSLARQITDQAYYPKAVTRTINYTKTIDSKTGTSAVLTFFVDENGIPVADANSYAQAVKSRQQTIVNDPSLKSQIATSSSGH